MNKMYSIFTYNNKQRDALDSAFYVKRLDFIEFNLLIIIKQRYFTHEQI